MEIVIAIAIGIVAGIFVSVVVYAVAQSINRDVRDPNFEFLAVSPDVVCQNDVCPVLLSYSVTNLGESQQVQCLIDGAVFLSATEVSLAVLPNQANFATLAGLHAVQLQVVQPDRPNIPPIQGLSRSFRILDEDEPRYPLSHVANVTEEPAEQVQDSVIVATEEIAAPREPAAVVQFCKNSLLASIRYESGTMRTLGPAGDLWPPDTDLPTLTIRIDGVEEVEVGIGAEYPLPEAIPIGQGIRIDAIARPPEGIDEWPVITQVQWRLLLGIQCPEA